MIPARRATPVAPSRFDQQPAFSRHPAFSRPAWSLGDGANTRSPIYLPTRANEQRPSWAGRGRNVGSGGSAPRGNAEERRLAVSASTPLLPSVAPTGFEPAPPP
jgi:hypothetical protein